MAKGRKTGGGKRGPKQSTQDIRAAYEHLVKLNLPNMEGWIKYIANGVKSRYKDCKGKWHEVYIVKPDPARAMDCLAGMSEFCVPKLARTEHTGEGGGPVIVQSTPIDEAL